MNFGLLFELDEDDVEKSQKAIDGLMDHLGFPRKVNDRFYLSGKIQPIQTVVSFVEKAQKGAPWFCENIESIKIFEVGSMNEFSNVLKSEDEDPSRSVPYTE